ncbi:hypothetical protein LSH36_2389g00003 [Paralvinella palmiformis]|uniref:Uncharacterized protein n=1 Tax=Paralvinella palmiformis TaxID=53620 RepID=A0AAD9MPC9_9ANNE|nr:hypothetical protein LSH36_2389g00003 [Paralvinella palmiformis]
MTSRHVTADCVANWKDCGDISNPYQENKTTTKWLKLPVTLSDNKNITNDDNINNIISKRRHDLENDTELYFFIDNLSSNLKYLMTDSLKLYESYCYNISTELSVGWSIRGNLNRCKEAVLRVEHVLNVNLFDLTLYEYGTRDDICVTLRNIDEVLVSIDELLKFLTDKLMNFVKMATPCRSRDPCLCIDVISSSDSIQKEMMLLCHMTSGPEVMNPQFASSRLNLHHLLEAMVKLQI